MIQTMRTRTLGIAILTSLAIGLGNILPQQANAAPPSHHRHSVAKGMAAGVGAYAIAKHTGNNRVRAGRKRNFAQRHPVLTGVAAGAAVHHYSKHHNR